MQDLTPEIPQGIGVVTGLQQSFNWRGVAASALGAGAGTLVGQELNAAGTFGGSVGGQIARATASSFAGGLVAAAARGGRVSVTQVAIDAFGNALGSSLASASTGTNLQGQRPWSEANYESEMDRGSIHSIMTGGAQPGAAAGEPDAISQAYEYMRAHPQSGMPFNEVVDYYGGKAASGNLPSVIPDATRVGFNSRAGEIWSTDANTYPVAEQSRLHSADLAPLAVVGTGLRNSAATPFSLVTPDYYVKPGVVSTYYQDQVARFGDSNQPWHVRSLSFINATLAAPIMLFEEGGRGIMNVPYAGSQLGQHAAIFNQATDVDTKVIAGLSMAKFGSEGFVNAYAGGVLGRQVYVQAQDEAVSYWLKQQFDGDIRKFNEVYTSAVDGTRRLGYSFNGVNGYRAHNTELQATRRGEFMSLERPISPADVIERNALSPLWGNNATELYQVTTRPGLYFKGQVAPQSGWYQGSYFSLGGGNTQVFQPIIKLPTGDYSAPWQNPVRVKYGN